ncbi:hypothetical protein L1887_34298 [Cichorium endivia]|nr:hypothetical protein L1887_34298 [Cichorium endivia]
MNYLSDEDDKPLVFKRSSNYDRFKHANEQKPVVPKPVVRPAAKQKSESDDSEDDKPLCSTISLPSVGPSIKKHDDSDSDDDDDKPLSLRVNQNGSSSRDINISQIKKLNIGSDKIPPNEEISPIQPLVKKSKLSDSYSSPPINQKPVKPESESNDDDDRVPIS